MVTAGKNKDDRKDGEKEVSKPVLRPFWSGTISFGLVTVPVNLFPAYRHVGISLRMLDEDGVPLRRRYYCPREDREVPPERIVRGYEVGDEKYIVVRDEELEALEPRKSRDIDLTRFVPKSAISPAYFQRAYFLTPAGESAKAYRLLAEAMEKSGRVGIATVVMRGKEYLVAIIAERGILRAETMRFSDELRRPEDLGLESPRQAGKEEVETIAKLLHRHEAKQLPVESLHDSSTARLRELIEKKFSKGQDVVESPELIEEEMTLDLDEEEAGEEVDLLGIIRQELQNEHKLATNGHRARPRSKASGGGQKRRADKKTATERRRSQR